MNARFKPGSKKRGFGLSLAECVLHRMHQPELDDTREDYAELDPRCSACGSLESAPRVLAAISSRTASRFLREGRFKEGSVRSWLERRVVEGLR